MKASSCEIQTSNEDEKSSWAKFCRKHGVNPNLIMLKITLFVLHGGKNFVLFVFNLFINGSRNEENKSER